MRIGLITGEYPPDQGGVGDFTRELGRGLAALGHQVHVLTTRWEGVPPTPTSDPASPNLTVHRIIPDWGWGCWREILRAAQALRLEALDVQYQAAAYRMHPAINFLPRPAGRPPIVVTFHDLKVPYLFPKAGPLRWWVMRRMACQAEGVIVTNQEDYLRMEQEVSVGRLALIPIGSNIPPSPPPGYDRQAERARWGVGPDDLLLGYFGFLNKSKGVEELVRALALLVEQGLPVHLLMIGGRVGSSDPTNQAYAEQVERLIAELGLEDRVHWTGYTDPQRVSAGLLTADVCVLPYRDGVSFRRGTLHACLAHGRAVVTTQPTVPLPQVRDGENMLLAPPRDPHGLAEVVMRVARDPDLRARLEVGAAALAAEFAWERISRRTTAFLAELTGKSSRPSDGPEALGSLE